VAKPNVVKGKSDDGVQPATRHQHATDRCIPALGDAHRRRAGLVEGQHHREHAGQENPEQPDHNEVVRRVGERTRISALSDVKADVPDEAEQRHNDHRDEHGDRQRNP
jgi:hypothetical protein